MSRSVFHTQKGWADKDDGASQPAGYYGTQEAAIAAAKGHLKNQGGGELTVHGLDGKIRDKITVAPGNDPCPPRDKR